MLDLRCTLASKCCYYKYKYKILLMSNCGEWCEKLMDWGKKESFNLTFLSKHTGVNRCISKNVGDVPLTPPLPLGCPPMSMETGKHTKL